MSSISVNWQELYGGADALNQYRSQLGRYQHQMEQARSGLRATLGLSSFINLVQLSNCIRRLDDLQSRVHALSGALKDVAYNYEAAEAKILGKPIPLPFIGAAAGWTSTGGTGTEEGPDYSFPWWKLFKGSPIGGVISAIGGAIASDDPPILRYSSLFNNLIKSGIGVAKTAQKVQTGEASWFSGLVGLTNKAADFDPNGSIFGQAFRGEFEDFAKHGSKLEVAGSVVKWAGAILSLGTIGYDNYKEYQNGEISGGRAVLETAGEFGVDLLADAAITAGVTAAMVAAFGSAPAIAVAAGTVAVAWAVDSGFKAIFGEGYKEVVSDFILDTGKAAIDAVADGAKKVGSYVAKGAEAVGGYVSDGAKAVGKWVKGLFR